jgi:hypothetical protein
VKAAGFLALPEGWMRSTEYSANFGILKNLADLAGVLAFGGARDVAEADANQYRWL